jgi:chromosome segregation and condensation protein ScpB
MTLPDAILDHRNAFVGTGRALQTYWLHRLPEGERKTLQVAISAYPSSVDRADIDKETGYKRSSRDAYVQRLRTRRLITITGRGEVRASDNLF